MSVSGSYMTSAAVRDHQEVIVQLQHQLLRCLEDLLELQDLVNLAMQTPLGRFLLPNLADQININPQCTALEAYPEGTFWTPYDIPHQDLHSTAQPMEASALNGQHLI